MAEDEGEKTEEPTSKKIEDARKEGNVPKSQDASGAITLFVAILTLLMLFSFMKEHLIHLIKYFFSLQGHTELTRDTLMNIAIVSIKEFLLIVIPFSLVIAISGIIGSVAQFGFLFNSDAIAPKFDKLNFISGFKNLFSLKKALEGLKTTLKSLTTLGIGFYFFFLYTKELPTVALFGLHEQLAWMIKKAIILAVIMLFVIAVFALADLIIVRKQYIDNLKMTKQEVKDEMKNMEGDPLIKSKIRQIQMQASRKRMMAEIPNADVVVTNPTHYAVAIKYDEKKSRAPVVVAKGMNHIAIQIKKIARENNVHIVQNPPLARSLYAQVEVEREIPEELFAAVAEVLAYVYKMNRK
ncbi:flagellar biosynthesis protein FlhB [Sulfurimonas sp. HSL-1716]|uniref:flagellar biosynthesis protein FlhB n=1 Tax=Hydrocurvibacter sulfurireducens TaxID=3131937 RepID=UPI0031F8492F